MESVRGDTVRVLLLARLEAKAGGGASYSKLLIKALEEQGIEIKVTSSFWKAIFSREKVIHIQHEPLYYGNLKSVLFPFLVPILHWIGKKVVITYHGVFNEKTLAFYAKERYPRLQWFARIISNFVFKLSTRYVDVSITHSLSMKRDLERQFKLKPESVKAVMHGIGRWERKMVPHSRRTVSMFGFYGEHQYNDVLIAASKLLPSVRFNITDQWVEDVQSFLSETDLFVFPETNRVSESGILCMAIGYGLPVLAYDDPVFRDLGVDLFETLEPEKLARIIDKVINDDTALEEMSLHSKEIAERYSWANTAKETKKIYESLIA